MHYCKGCGNRVSLKKLRRNKGYHGIECRKVGGKISAKGQRLRRLAKK